MDYAGFYHSGDGIFRTGLFCPCLYAVETRTCEYGHVGGRQYGSGIFVQSVQHDLAGILDESGIGGSRVLRGRCGDYCSDFVGAFAGGKGQVQYFDRDKEIDGVTTQNGD